jgi:hypothetical protein
LAKFKPKNKKIELFPSPRNFGKLSPRNFGKLSPRNFGKLSPKTLLLSANRGISD